MPIAIHIEVLNREVEWLMGLPFGFKTNRQLNSMLGKFITFFILLWYVIFLGFKLNLLKG